MKRVITLLLAFVLMLSMCACGNKELPAEEKAEIYQMIMAEKTTKMLCSVPQQEIDSSSMENSSDFAKRGGVSNNESDFLLIEDIELIPISGNIYQPNFKIRCVFPKDKVLIYPQFTDLDIQYLDSSGDVIAKHRLQFQGLDYNKAVWSETAAMTTAGLSFSATDVSAITFSGYGFFSLSGYTVDFMDTWFFIDPPVFQIADMGITLDTSPEALAMANAYKSDQTVFSLVSDTPKDDPIVPEEITLKNSKSDQSQHIVVKIRNISENDIDVATVRICALDQNGDLIAQQVVSARELRAGRASISNNHTLYCPYKSVYKLEVMSYELGNYSGSSNSWAVYERGSFEEPLVLELNCGNNQSSGDNENSKNQYDIVVEDCAVAWEGNGYVAIKPKVHNYTDMDAQFLGLNCELVGKDGRTMRVTLCDTGGIAAGANEWVSGTIRIKDDEISALAELKFSGGGFDVLKDGICLRQTVRFAETTFTKEHVFGE